MLRSRASVYAEPIAKASSRFPLFRKMLSVFNRKPAAIHPTNSRSPVIHPVAMPIPPTNIEIANRWIEEPLVNPYTGDAIEVSIHPDSAYVKLYKKVIKGLIADLLTHQEEKYILTIEECKYIKDNLPIIHSIIPIKDEYIRYDHLFIRYFVNKKEKGNYIYDIRYREDSDIKLYLNIYKSIKTKNPTSLSPKVSPKQIKIERLKPLPHTGEFKKRLELLGQPPTKSLKPLLSPLPPSRRLQAAAAAAASQSPSSRSFAIENYKTLEDLLKDNIDLDKSNLSIGKLVANMCVDIKYILYMRNDDITLDNYKVALHNKKTLEYVRHFYALKFVDRDIKVDIKITQEAFPEHNIEDIYMIYYNTTTKGTKGTKGSNLDILTRYIDVYNSILLLYAGFFNSRVKPQETIVYVEDKKIKRGPPNNPYCPNDVDDPITQENVGVLGYDERKYVSTIIIYDLYNKKVRNFCYDTIAIYNYILQFIVNSKNQPNTIIKDASELQIPLNPYLYIPFPFTDDELDEICNKIKFLTKVPTYNSHIDIKEAINQQYMETVKERIAKQAPEGPTAYNLWLKELYISQEYYNKNNGINLKTTVEEKVGYDRDIKGTYNIYLATQLGELLLNVVNVIPVEMPYITDEKFVALLLLPHFKDDRKDTIIQMFMSIIERLISNGKYISNETFPYRIGRNPIMSLKPFVFSEDEDAVIVFRRFILYANTYKSLGIIELDGLEDLLEIGRVKETEEELKVLKDILQIKEVKDLLGDAKIKKLGGILRIIELKNGGAKQKREGKSRRVSGRGRGRK